MLWRKPPLSTFAHVASSCSPYEAQAVTDVDDGQSDYYGLPSNEQSRRWDAMGYRIVKRDGDATMGYLMRPMIVAETVGFLNEVGVGLAAV